MANPTIPKTRYAKTRDDVHIAYQVVGSVPDGPVQAVRCMQAIVEAVSPLGIEVRAGVHTGELEPIDGKVGGRRVVIGARVGAFAGPSEVLVSLTVRDLTAGSGLTLEDAGEHEIKGGPDRWRPHRVVR